MGKAKRCRSVVISAGVAALGATGACPAQSSAATATRAARPATTRKHTDPHRRPAAHHGPYVYEAILGGVVSETHDNAYCSGSTIRFVGVQLVGEGRLGSALWERSPNAGRKRYVLAAGPATTITMPWTSEQDKREAAEHNGEVPNPKGITATATAGTVCAATSPDAALGSVGEGTVTWRLPAPASSVAALLANAPVNISLNELMVAFAIQPNGSVPVFNPSAVV